MPIRKLSVLLAICAVSLGTLAGAADGVQSNLDSIFAPLAAPRSPGLAVLVQKDGRTLFQNGYGVRDLRTFTRIDAATNFRLASFTKQFTAMAIMLLVHDGKLRYDEKLTEVFPDFPAYGRSITLRNLLNHTSGLPDYEELMTAAEKEKGATWTSMHQIQDGEVLELLKQQTHGKFAPGTSWSYSNSGYVVLGLVAAKAAGKPFDQFLHDRIFEPLGMRNTLIYINGKNSPPNRAYGHTKEGNRFTETDQSSTSATLGDGGIYSNLTDLAKWDMALGSGALLSEDRMKPALTAVRLLDGSEPRWPAQPGDDHPNADKPVSYGFGWFLDPYRGHARMWHSGSTRGFVTVIDRFKEERLTIVILCNRTDLDPSALALRTVDTLLP